MAELPRGDDDLPTLKEVFGTLHVVSPIEYVAMVTWWERLIDTTDNPAAKKTLVVMFNDALPRGVAKWRQR